MPLIKKNNVDNFSGGLNGTFVDRLMSNLSFIGETDVHLYDGSTAKISNRKNNYGDLVSHKNNLYYWNGTSWMKIAPIVNQTVDINSLTVPKEYQHSYEIIDGVYK